MARYCLLPIALAGLLTVLLTGCAGVTVGRPTPVPGPGRLGVPQPTATQIAVGANPTPSAPRVNPIVAQVRPASEPSARDPYGWLESVRSKRTRHWIAAENRATHEVLAGLPRRAWIRDRLGQIQAGGTPGASDDVVVERVFYLTPDGIRLPIEIAHRRNLARDGNQPTLLTVYHATGKPPERLLQPLVLVWLEMGGVFARAEVRNGLARVAAPRGVVRLPDRSIALSDLFSAAQSLIDGRYTRRARLGIYGRGFGGLMAGAAVSLRPDFFGLALPTGTWSQYLKIVSGNCFPPTLITTAEHGSFRPWRGYELAAALQAEQICGRPILIRVERDEETAEPVALRREGVADELAFAARWLGLPAPRPPA